MSLSRIFDIAQRSLGAYQKALDVTSHNVANASNPHYSRQRVNFGTEIPEINAGMIWGSGVRLESIERVRNQLTESQIINNRPKYSFNEKQSYLLGQVENVLSEPSELGLSNLINEFLNSWSELSATPNSIPLRNNVLYSAQKLSAKVNTIGESFDITKSDIISEFKSNVTMMNGYLEQIQSLNARIFEAKSRGITPNDFLDERDKLINELSSYTNINVSYDNNNMATISIGGVFAVDATSYVKFEAYEKDGELSLRSINNGNQVALKGGELYALADVYSNKIPNYQSQLDNVVNAIRDEVNNIHSQGYSIDDPPQTGINFFLVTDPGKLVINSEILNDPYKISVSSDASNGNSDLAIALSEIADKKVINNLTISEAYSSLVSGIGNNKQYGCNG